MVLNATKPGFANMLKTSSKEGYTKLTMREIAVIFDPERKLFLYFGVVALAVGMGPFGTYEAMTFWQRLMFWSLDILGGLAIIVPVVHVFYHSRFAQWLPSFPRLVGGITLGAIPGAGFVTLLYNSIGADIHISTSYPLLLIQMVFFSTLLLLTEYVLWPLVFGSSPQRQSIAEQAVTIPTPTAPALPRLTQRLPPNMRAGQIISISMQDHYAQVVTSKGEHLLLIRLSDAIDLLDGLPGQQIHRSHWVATNFAESLHRSGRRHDLRLKDGRTLPVSAAHLEAVQAMLEQKAAD